MRLSNISTMSLDEIVVKLAEGNPGAVTVLASCRNLLNDNTTFIDLCKRIDELELYGSKIWETHKDRCNQNTSEFIKLVCSDKIPQERLHNISTPKTTKPQELTEES